jgi:peptide/nickel transport system substrate-binding protein
MSRNLTVQLTIAALLAAVLLAVIINIVQFNAIEGTVQEARQKVEHNTTLLNQLKEKVDSGVTVNNGGALVNNGAPATPDRQITGKNLLEPDPTPLRVADAAPGGELRLAISSDFKGFNFLIENSVDVSEVQAIFVGSFLARRHYTDPDKWHGDLAEAITVNDDFTEYHIYLRKGVKWHRPAVDASNPRYKWLDKDHFVTSDDFKFLFEMLLDPRVAGAASLRSYFDEFKGIEVINDHEFKLVWKKKVFQSLAFSLEMYPLPRWLYGFNEDGEPFPAEIVADKFNSHWYNDRAIGTGPFRFVESKPGESMTMVRNEEYFAGKPALEKVTYKIIKDTNLTLLKFKNNEVDLMFLSPTQYRKEILEANNSPFVAADSGKEGQFYYQTVPRLAYRYLGWNAKDPLFSDPRTRNAMTHAFNRQKMIDEVFVGLGRVVTGNIYIDSPFSNPNIKPHAFDLDKARALLAEAGWTDSDKDGVLDKLIEGRKVNFEFKMLIYNSLPEFKTLADIYKEDLIKVGIKMNVQPADWPLMQKSMEDKEFQAFTGGWGLGWDTDPHQIFHSSQADVPKGSNFVNFRNEEADKIIDELRVTFDNEARKKMLWRFHEIVHEVQPYTFFMAPTTIMAYHKGVHNMTTQKPRPQFLYHMVWKDKE